jgi:hypothetical protein
MEMAVGGLVGAILGLIGGTGPCFSESRSHQSNSGQYCDYFSPKDG